SGNNHHAKLFDTTGARIERSFFNVPLVGGPKNVSPPVMKTTPPELLGVKPGAWPSGSNGNVMPGLALTPASLPRVKRWQVDYVSPRPGSSLLAWSKNGRVLAAGDEAQLRIFARDEGGLRLLRILPGTSPGGIAFGSDPKILAVWHSGDGNEQRHGIRFWDL